MIVCLVTPGTLIDDRSAEADRLIERISEAARAGVDLIQIRERGLAGAALLRFAQRAAMAAAPVRLVINERADIALASGAAGVHLRADSMPAARLRTIAPSPFVIGRSVHAEEEAVAVEAEGGIDYLLFGTVYPSASKPPGHQATGVEALGRVAKSVRLPVIAIGGITAERVDEVIAAGASGVAAIGMFRATGPIASIVSRLKRAD